MKKNSPYVEECRAYVTPPETYLTVDTELQLKLVDLLLRERMNRKKAV
jgi:hypothetical protein